MNYNYYSIHELFIKILMNLVVTSIITSPNLITILPKLALTNDTALVYCIKRTILLAH